MKRNRKILLGVAAFWPVIFVLVMLAGTVLLQMAGDTIPGDIAYLVGKILFWVTLVLVLAQIIGYGFYVLTADNISQLGKFKYLALLIIGHLFTLPLIWRTFVWQEKFLKKS